jgi:hypothetical protein
VLDVVARSTGFNYPYFHDRIYVFSGRDGRELYQMRGIYLDATMTLLPPSPGNPFPLLVVPNYQTASLPEVGSITLFRMMPEGATYLGDACTTGNGLRIGLSPQSPTVRRGRVTLSGATPGTACALLIGRPTTPFELRDFGYAGCWQYSSGSSLVLPLVLEPSGPNRGMAASELPLPFGVRVGYLNPAFDWQGVSLLPNGLLLSAGIRARVLL